VDWELLKQAFETRVRRSFFERLSAKPLADCGADATSHGWFERLDKIAPEDRRDLMASLVAEETRQVLGLDAKEQLDPGRGLFELGLDSLMSIQLKRRLEKSIGCALPSTLTFTYPTVYALTDFLLGQARELLTNGVGLSSPTESNEEQPVDEDLADLSDDEIKDLLSAELSSLHQDSRD
jgi:myxalamid-type polyketide synthase MxaE and MxaD